MPEDHTHPDHDHLADKHIQPGTVLDGDEDEPVVITDPAEIDKLWSEADCSDHE